MNFYDLVFADGKTGRCIIMEPDEDPAVDVTGVHSIFSDGYLVTMDRVIAPPPARLPWKRRTETLWTLGLFALSRLPDGQFHCFWPGGQVTGGKEEISAAVRENWANGV